MKNFYNNHTICGHMKHEKSIHANLQIWAPCFRDTPLLLRAKEFDLSIDNLNLVPHFNMFWIVDTASLQSSITL